MTTDRTTPPPARTAAPGADREATEHAGPLLVHANFASDLAVGLRATAVLGQWAEQAPRTMWLLRPGDVLLTPVPLPGAFQEYAARLLGLSAGDVTVVPVPPCPGVPFAEAVERAGLLPAVRELVAARPGIALLPTALDESAAAFARDLGIPVTPYGREEPTPEALKATSQLNTKSGFRAAAAALGLRVPEGRVCRHAELDALVARMIRDHRAVVVKPDRSAGGHGLTFVRAAAPGQAPGPLSLPPVDDTWVVEECVDVAHSLSTQAWTGPAGTAVLFSGEMRTRDGSFTGYEAPLRGPAAAARGELEEWARVFGTHLGRHGYAGPFSLDAVVTRRGVLHANESNVRRTATTTPHAMVTRLARAAGRDDPAWCMGRRRAPAPYTFEQAVRLLDDSGLGWSAGRGEGAVLYAGPPTDGRTWRHVTIAPTGPRLDALEERLTRVLGPVV
ncbi:MULTISPECIES: hypothetical protein [unclassified Streptomyces]|uniref:preATP grasp domain-containing protein n=1 Tax=unclassified Streptomyces TaxID=2593676 RepID=UPI0036C010E9